MAKGIKIFAMIFLMIFLIGFVSAVEFDNVKNYNPETKTIEVRNSILGIPFLQLDQVAEIQLLSNLNQFVVQGYGEVARFKVTNYDDYTNAFKELELYNINSNNKKFERDFDFKTLSYETIEVNDYETILIKTLSNGSKIYGSQITGFHQEQKEVWTKINIADFEKDEVIIVGIFTDVNKGDYVEWIPNFFGVRIDEWAIWQESYELNLRSHYALNNTAGNVIDDMGNTTGTNNGADRGVEGIINNSFNFVQANSDYVDVGTVITNYGTATFNAWVKTLDGTGQFSIIANQLAGKNDDCELSFLNGVPTLYRQDDTTATNYQITGSTNISDGSWHMVTGILNSSGMFLFVDGENEGVTDAFYEASTNQGGWGIGGEASGTSARMNGSIDEVFVYDRSLTQSEITSFYDGGLALLFRGKGLSDAPTIILNSPVNEYNSSNRTIVFNGTVFDDFNLANVSLYIDGVLNETNSSGINSRDYIPNETGIVGYWRGDGNADDSSGFGNDGTLINGATANQTGVYNYSFGLDGIGDSLMLPNSTEFELQERYTLSLWIKPTGIPTTFNDLISSRSGENHFLLRRETNNKIAFHDWTGGGNQLTIFSDNPLSINEWHYLIATRDNNTLYLYVDNVLQTTTQNPSGTLSYSNSEIYLGSGGGTRYFNGSIDEVMIFNRSLDQTEVTALYNAKYDYYTFTKNFEDGKHNWTLSAWDNESQETIATTRNFTIDTSPNISFETPTLANNTNHTGNYIPVNVSLTESYFVNVTFDFYNGSLTSYTYTDSTRLINETFADDTYDYNVTVWTSTGQTNSTETRRIIIDTTYPTITELNNLTNLTAFSFPINSSWNYTAVDDNLNVCWYNNVTGGTNYTISCNSQINTTWATEGWKNLQYCVNDTHGFETCNQSSIYVFSISDWQNDDLDPVGEGVNVTYTLQVNVTNTPTTTATLLLNNTYYSATKTSYQDYTEFTRVITIPDTWGSPTGNNINWSWNYTVAGATTNHTTDLTNTTVYEMAIDDCSSYGDTILNLSLKDEEGNTLVNGSAGSTIELDLRLTSIANPNIFIDYNNTWTNVNVSAVCVPTNLLTNSEYKIDFTIGYEATDKVWEFFYLDDGVLNSTKKFDAYTTSVIDLMDLITVDSTSFLFNFFDVDGLPVDNSIVHVFRKYIGEGLFREVERGKADQNGDTVIHLVEEDVIYYFVVTEDGDHVYTSSTYTALCQATPCAIQLEASGESAEFSTDYDLVPDGNFTINSSLSTRKVSLVYDMDVATKYNFTLYKYESDGSFTSVASGEETGTSGIITLSVPLSAGNVSFFSTVLVEDEFITSEWVDFEDKAEGYFGRTLSLFLAFIIVLTLGLVAVSEGAGAIIFVVIGVLVSGALGLISTKLSTGINIIIYLIVAGALLIWKLTGGRK